MTDEEFSDTLAIANTLPGPIATKMGGYIGYRVAGVVGCIGALLATVAPTAIIMIFYCKFYKNLKIYHGYNICPCQLYLLSL